MRVLLINETSRRMSFYLQHLQPLGILYIASFLQSKGINVDVRDYGIQKRKKIDFKNYSLVGFSMTSGNVERTLLSIKNIKKNNSTPNKVVDKKFKVMMDNGKEKEFQGYRVQFNDSRGPYKGGIRFHPKVDLSEVKSLAFWMALKTAVVNIPLGGGKGGVVVNSKELSNKELENLSRGFIRAIHKHIGPMKDIPAPDMYTTPQIMVWMLDEFEKIQGKHVPGMITGKPLEVGGSEGRFFSTSQGGAYVLRELMKLQKKNPKHTAVAIQGFGNAGSLMAKILDKWGYKIIAVSDSKGGVYDENGLDIDAVINYKKRKQKCERFCN